MEQIGRGGLMDRFRALMGSRNKRVCVCVCVCVTLYGLGFCYFVPGTF